jgi:TPR repeat protein
MYDNGQGTEKNVDLTIQWFKKAANQNGQGVVKNKEEAAENFEMAVP